MLKELKNNWIFYVCLLLFISITFPIMITHCPHCDEAQNYMASYFMNLSNWPQISSLYGHPLLWYLILFPVSKTQFMYPYSMLILNYIFLIAALVVMWKKAPFDIVFKIIITFSYMMIAYFAVVARCYTIGILGLFILAALYENRLKKPILYSVLLGFTANTSAMAAIPVIPLSAIFFIELYKLRRKEVSELKIVCCFFILFFFACLFLYPFIMTSTYHFDGMYNYMTIVNHFFMPIKNNYIFIIAFSVVSVYLLTASRDIKSKIFFLISLVIFGFFFKYVYTCLDYHRFFIFIIIILTMWLQNLIKKYDKYKILIFSAFAIIMMMPYDLSYCNGNQNLYEFGQKFAKERQKYSNSIIVAPEFGIRYEVAPFIIPNKENIDLYDTQGSYNYYMHEDNTEDAIESIKQFAKNQDKKVYILTEIPIDNMQLTDKHNSINLYSLE